MQPRDGQQAAFTPDETGFFGIRLESIGGYGAHLAGRILAEAAVLHQGYGGAHFSSYGSEKKGTPVRSYVRLCRAGHPIRTSAPIDQPHVIAVFHAALARTQDVVAGLRPGGTVVVNTPHPPAAAAALVGLAHGTVGSVDATRIALEEGSRPNMALLGALCRALPFLDPEAVRAVIRSTFARKRSTVVTGNLRAFDRGYQEVAFAQVAADRPPARVAAPEPHAYGYLDAPIGGVIVDPGTTVHRDWSAARLGYLPEFLRDKCIDCALCDLTCPDMCFVWEPGRDRRGQPALVLKGIDYRFCKGCLRCIEVCPTGALVLRREEDGWAEAHRVPHPLLEAARSAQVR